MRLRTHRTPEDTGFRGWATLSTRAGRDLAEVGLEANSNRGYKHCHATVEVNGDDHDVQVALAIPYVFSVYLSWSLPPARWLWGWMFKPGRLGYGRRETGITIFHKMMWIRLFADDMGSTREWRWPWLHEWLRTPWVPRCWSCKGEGFRPHWERPETTMACGWCNGTGRARRDMRRTMRPDAWGCHGLLAGIELTLRLSPATLLFGAQDTQTLEAESHRAVVPMPEGNYPATVTLERKLTCRSRWGRWPTRRRVWVASTVEPDFAIPVPGKGENSWDCDDDAVFSQYGSHGSVAEACASLAGSAMNSRERYASLDWMPREGWPEGVVRA